MDFKTLLNIHGKIDWRELSPQSVATGLCFDSRQLKQGDVYIAVRGHTVDGHKFLYSVCKQASAVVVEDSSLVPASFKGTVVEVLDTRLSLQVLSQLFYEKPGERLTAIAVTGTNGKTSSAYILESLINFYGGRCGVMGTIDHHLGDKVWSTELTTPDPITLQQRIKEFADMGADSFVIEASSHALSQNRIHQGFDVCVFTNLSRDHLDYHPTMEEYFQAKALLFGADMVKSGKDAFAIINGDDPYGVQLASQSPARQVFCFGQGDENDMTFKITNEGLSGVEFSLNLPDKKMLNFKSPLIGLHNVYNLVGSLSALYALNYDLDRAIPFVLKFTGVPGRLQSVPNSKKIHSFVDYAHTPEALQKVLQSLKQYTSKGQRLLCVFGCGGDRDKGKRPLMAQAAEKYSDQIVVTSDNPRGEEPLAIIDDIAQGLKRDNSHIVEVDRALAIKKVVDIAVPGDVILVAGKGHEDYQIIGDNKNHFSDFEQLQLELNRVDSI